MPKIIRITTVPQSLKDLQKGQNAFLRQNGFDIIGVSAPGKELKIVEEREGIRTVPLLMTRTISPILDLKALWSFYKLCKKEKPSIVHSHTPKAGIVGMLGAKLAGVPIRMHTVAGLPLVEVKGIKRKILNFVERLTSASATNLYPISFGIRDLMIQEKLAPEEKLKVIGKGSSNGIDTGYFNPDLISEQQKAQLKEKLSITTKDIVFIFVGRIVGDKGINELIASFMEINQSFPFTKLILVGRPESELDPISPESAIRIKNNKNIIAVGYQNDIRPYLAISDVFTFPSYREGFGNVTAQAGAMNIPAIVADITGSNEIIEDGVNGIIIPVKNSKALILAMKKMVEDKKLREKLSLQSRRMIQERYEQNYVWQELLKEYRNLLTNT